VIQVIRNKISSKGASTMPAPLKPAIATAAAGAPPPPAAPAPPAAPDDAALPPSQPDESGGPKGPEPTRFGDWERKGRCIDF
jgi:hypothetical protein